MGYINLKMKNNKILVPLINGFEETEYIAVRDVLIREGFDVESVSLTNDKIIIANHNTRIGADILFNNIKNTLYDYDVLFIPGGVIGVEKLDKSLEFEIILNSFVSENKIISAICAAPSLLAKRGLLKNKKAVIFPSKKLIKTLINNKVNYNSKLEFVGDGIFFTGINMQTSITFAYALSKYIKKHQLKI